MGGHDKNTTTRTQENKYDAPDWAQPLYKELSKHLSDLYKNGAGGHVYQGKRLGDLSDTTKDAISGFRDMAEGNHANPMLQDMAQGKLIGHNSAFNDSLANNLNKTADLINSQFSGAGRYGSGANSSVLAQKLGEVASNANAQQYNQDVSNMFSANNALNNDFTNRLNAYRNMLQGGHIQDQHNQDAVNSNWRKFLEQDNENVNRLNSYTDMLRRLSGNYGNNTITDREENPTNPLSIFGGGLGILGDLVGDKKGGSAKKGKNNGILG